MSAVTMVSAASPIHGWEDAVNICVCEIVVWPIVVSEPVTDCVMSSG